MGSSGAFDLNLDAAKCARLGCGHRRDLHATHGGTHRFECSQCECHEFVIGGPDDFSKLADSSEPPPPEKP